MSKLELTQEQIEQGYRLVNSFLYDKNDNRWDLDIYASLDEALETSKSLVNCTNCTNCEDCTNCTNCESCGNCKECQNCKICEECNGCEDCISCTKCEDCVESEEQVRQNGIKGDGVAHIM